MFFFLEDAVAFNRGYLILDVLLHCDFLLISQIRKVRKNTDLQKSGHDRAVHRCQTLVEIPTKIPRKFFA